MNSEKRDFDKVADAWDEDPTKVRLANNVADSLIQQVSLTSGMDVLDFGCGTGLLTLRLQPFVRTITGVDSSMGMLNIINSKIDKLLLPNVMTKMVDLAKGDSLEGRYDLVVSSMTMHHVHQIAPLIKQFYQIIAAKGCLCIADLDLDNGQFHRDNTGVFHHGFDRSALRRIFEDAGFENVRDVTAAEVVKPVSNGGMKPFTLFLMIGEKKAC